MPLLAGVQEQEAGSRTFSRFLAGKHRAVSPGQGPWELCVATQVVGPWDQGGVEKKPVPSGPG